MGLEVKYLSGLVIFFFSFEIFVILGDIYHWLRRKFSKFSFSFFFVFTINFNLVINNL